MMSGQLECTAGTVRTVIEDEEVIPMFASIEACKVMSRREA